MQPRIRAPKNRLTDMTADIQVGRMESMGGVGRERDITTARAFEKREARGMHYR